MKIVPCFLVAHRGDVGPSGGARSHYDCNLRDAFAAHSRLVIKNSPEMFLVRKCAGLKREEDSAGVDEVNAGQMIVEGDFLRAHVFLDGHREVCAAFDGGVVRDDHALAAVDPSDPRDDSRAGTLIVVLLPCRERGEFEKRRASIEEGVDSVAGEHFSAFDVSLSVMLRSAFFNFVECLFQFRDEIFIVVGIFFELVG